MRTVDETLREEMRRYGRPDDLRDLVNTASDLDAHIDIHGPALDDAWTEALADLRDDAVATARLLVSYRSDRMENDAGAMHRILNAEIPAAYQRELEPSDLPGRPDSADRSDRSAARLLTYGADLIAAKEDGLLAGLARDDPADADLPRGEVTAPHYERRAEQAAEYAADRGDHGMAADVRRALYDGARDADLTIPDPDRVGR